jgi:hypothetical protein
MEILAASTALSYSAFAPPGLGGGPVRAQQSQAADQSQSQIRGQQQSSTPQKTGAQKESGAQKELSAEEQKQVEKLKRRDAEVRAHEAAHMAAGSGLVRGGASYEYEQGPDGKKYAVGGEVSIDTSPVRGDPEATLAKAQKIRSAAMAPANPSSQDRRVAAQASQMAAEAQREMATEKQGGNTPDSSSTAAAEPNNKTGLYSSIQNNRNPRPALLDMFL